ncbi:MAG: class I adenylate-forming enzyme family protein [Pseudomonadota bacterium]
MNTFDTWLAAASPEALALSDDAGSLSYAALEQAIGAACERLRRQVQQPSYVFIRAAKNTATVVSILAAARAGHVAVPIDPDAPERTLATMAQRCGRAVIWDANDVVTSLTDGVIHGDVAATALLLFTSGTSGSPKGVPVSWGNLEHSVTTVSAYLDYASFSSAAVALPLHYSYALLTQVLAMLYVGGHARVFASFRNPIKFARAVNEGELQTFCGVPSTYQGLIVIHRLQALSMPSVRILCSAGAAMDKSLLPEIRAIFPNARFFDNYGMTEATPRISYISDDDPRFSEPTCGRAITGLEIAVFHPESDERLDDGEEGIVAVRGPNVFSGYLDDGAATERAFNASGFLLSGDLGFLQDSYLYITGRADDVFNVGGEKIAPLEIERALNEHPAVQACAVGKLTDVQRGVIAVAYLDLSSDVRRRDLIDFLGSRLPPAKVPTRYIRVQGFPSTANGKVQRSRLSPSDESFVIAEIT